MLKIYLNNKKEILSVLNYNLYSIIFQEYKNIKFLVFF